MALSKRQMSAILLVLLQEDEEEPYKERRLWTKPWPNKRVKPDVVLLDEPKHDDSQDFKNYLRMTDDAFRNLLRLVSPMITKKDTVMRKSISAEERLVATLRFLATGRSLEDLRFSTGISPQALGKLIPETCQAIYDALKSDHMKFPATSEEWLEIAEEFDNQWNFPNCGGAICGKHVSISRPSSSNSYYYNYKGYFSIVLMAVVNANLEFIMVDVGKNGVRHSDGDVLKETQFHQKLIENTLNLPEGDTTKHGLSFVFIADEELGSHEHLLKPFPQEDLKYEKKIFNYRLSRARRVVDNAFGILASRFRIFQTAIAMKTDKIYRVVLACCVLHNFLRRSCRDVYTPENMIDTEDVKSACVTEGEWRKDVDEATFSGLQGNGQSNVCDAATNARLSYVQYFNGIGKVPWQDRMVV